MVLQGAFDLSVSLGYDHFDGYPSVFVTSRWFYKDHLICRCNWAMTILMDTPLCLSPLDGFTRII